MSTVDYNDAFAAALRTALGDSAAEYPLKTRMEELSDGAEVERLFPGKSVLWLRKELSKWRGKLNGEDGRFHGTLQSLQLYCTLTGRLPNDVLLSGKTYAGPARVEFLRRSTILELAEKLRKDGTVPRHGIAIPVLYAPEKMTAVFLFLYAEKKAGEDAVCMRFGISEPDGYVDTEGGECLGGISTAADSSYYTADISRPEGMVRLAEAYDKICREFESVCAASESPMHDAVGEFYDLMGPWAKTPRDDLLFAWYPPGRTAAATAGSSLNDVLKQFALDTERER